MWYLHERKCNILKIVFTENIQEAYSMEKKWNICQYYNERAALSEWVVHKMSEAQKCQPVNTEIDLKAIVNHLTDILVCRFCTSLRKVDNSELQPPGAVKEAVEDSHHFLWIDLGWAGEKLNYTWRYCLCMFSEELDLVELHTWKSQPRSWENH